MQLEIPAQYNCHPVQSTATADSPDCYQYAQRLQARRLTHDFNLR